MLRRTLGLAAAVALTCGATIASKPDSTENDPQAWIEIVRATNRDRVTMDRESALWRDERRRLEALHDAVSTEAANAQSTLDEIERRIETTTAEIATYEEQIGSYEQANLALDNVARVILAALREIDRRAAPGCVVIPASKLVHTDGPQRGLSLSDALAALRRSEAAVDTVDLGVHIGRLEGRETAAHVLRVSGAAAWWLALDESRGGFVERETDSGDVMFRPVADPLAFDEIRAAIGIAAGHTPPRPCRLPLVPLRPEAAR